MDENVDAIVGLGFLCLTLIGLWAWSVEGYTGKVVVAPLIGWFLYAVFSSSVEPDEEDKT